MTQFLQKFTSHNVSLRPFEKGDTDSIKAIVFSALREYGLQPEPDGVDSDLETIDLTYGDSNSQFWVLESLGERHVVGCFALSKLSNDECELRKMYFSPNLRGLGLGYLVIQYCIHWALQKKFKVMTLETASCLEEAMHLYRRVGFTPVQEKVVVERCDTKMSLSLEKYR